MNSRSGRSSTSPLVGLMIESCSTSSPQNSTRKADFLVGRPDLDAIAPHAELARLKLDVVPLVLDVDQLGQHLVAVDRLPDAPGRPSSPDSLRASRGRRCRRRWPR